MLLAFKLACYCILYSDALCSLLFNGTFTSDDDDDDDDDDAGSGGVRIDWPDVVQGD